MLSDNATKAVDSVIKAIKESPEYTDFEKQKKSLRIIPRQEICLRG